MKKFTLLLTLALTSAVSAFAADSFVLCTDASQLKAGTQFYLGDPNQTPQTLMGAFSGTNYFSGVDATITDGTVAETEGAALLTLEDAGNGKWYIKDGDEGYLFFPNNNGQASLRTDNKSELTIEVDADGTARIAASWFNTPVYMVHNDYNGVNKYVFHQSEAATFNRLLVRIYVKEGGSTPVTPAPQAVTFSPAAGEVEAGTVVTATAKGATQISYTYNGKTEQANAESISITIDAAGTVSVTASNAGGTVTGQAAYTIKAQPVAAPSAVTFSPAAGEVKAGTVVTATAKGATHISYTYNGKSNEANAESISITIDAEGTVTVTASNEGGTVTGQAAYTIKETPSPIVPNPDEELIYSGLNSNDAECNWILSNDMVFWTPEADGDGYVLDFGWTGAYAYDPTPIVLPTADQITITARFEQNTSVYGTRFLIRENGTETWDELVIQTIDSNNSRTTFYPVALDLSSYKGKTVQVGFSYPDGEDEIWDVRNLMITSKAETGIAEVAVDANAPVVYYNLQGVRVDAANIPNGIYIRQQGHTTTKVLVK